MAIQNGINNLKHLSILTVDQEELKKLLIVLSLLMMMTNKIMDIIMRIDTWQREEIWLLVQLMSHHLIDIQDIQVIQAMQIHFLQFPILEYPPTRQHIEFHQLCELYQTNQSHMSLIQTTQQWLILIPLPTSLQMMAFKIHNLIMVIVQS